MQDVCHMNFVIDLTNRTLIFSLSHARDKMKKSFSTDLLLPKFRDNLFNMPHSISASLREKVRWLSLKKEMENERTEERETRK